MTVHPMIQLIVELHLETSLEALASVSLSYDYTDVSVRSSLQPYFSSVTFAGIYTQLS